MSDTADCSDSKNLNSSSTPHYRLNEIVQADSDEIKRASRQSSEDSILSPSKIEEKDPLQRLIYAAKNGFDEHVKSYLQEQKYRDVVNMADAYDRYTPLMFAASAGKADVVRVLCQHSEIVNINLTGGWNDTTALIRAVERGHLEVVSVLIEFGADLNKKNKGGMTALMLAAEIKESLYEDRQYLAIISLLIEGGANINQINADEYTALNLAASEGNAKVVSRLLQEKTIEVDIMNKFGKTAFFNACEFGKKECAELLFKHGANKNFKSKRGATPIMLAAVKCKKDIVDFLLNEGVDLTVEIPPDKGAENILSMACSGGNVSIIKAIIEKDPATVCKSAYLALLSVCKNPKTSMDTVNLLFSKLREHDVNIPSLLRKQDGDGNTCFMHACNIGHMDVLCSLLEVEYPDPALLPIEDVTALFVTKNLTGYNAVTLLANHYKDTWANVEDSTSNSPSKDPKIPDTSFEGFLTVAISNNFKWPFLLDMIKFILPNLKSPIALMHKYGERIKNGLHYGHIYATKPINIGQPNQHLSDLNLVGSLTSVAAALKLAAEKNSMESEELTKICTEYETMIKICMKCSKLEDPENVTKILIRQLNINTDQTLVHKARAFLHGPLRLCIDHDLTKFLATSQIRKHVEDVFSKSMKERIIESIGSINDLVQLRSGCATYRYCPIVMFSFEAMMKVVFLILVIVGIALEASPQECLKPVQDGYFTWMYKKVYCIDPWYWNGYIVVMLVTSWMYEFGEIFSRFRQFSINLENLLQLGSEAVEHFYDQWNLIDLGTVTFVSAWFYWRYFLLDGEIAQTFLCLSAISLSVGILRFLSIWEHTGQLVIMYFGMLKDLAPFLLVFLIFVLGFGIALHGIFPDIKEKTFSNVGQTFLTLFDAALGQHNFSVFDREDDNNILNTSLPSDSFKDWFKQFVGASLMVSYIVLVMIVLLNLIVARMTSTHDKIETRSLEIWSKVQSKNVDEFVMNYDRNPMCMLPAPFNLIPISCSLCEWISGLRKPDLEPSSSIKSITGTVCDVVTSVIFSPWGAGKELWLASTAVRDSSIPRNTQLFLRALFFLLSPVWFIFFWVEILISIYSECGTYINPLSRAIVIDKIDYKPAFTLDKRSVVRLFVTSGSIFKYLAPYFGISRRFATIWFSIFGSTAACFAIDRPLKKSFVHYILNHPLIKPFVMSFIERYRGNTAKIPDKLDSDDSLESETPEEKIAREKVIAENEKANAEKEKVAQEKLFNSFAMVVFICVYGYALLHHWEIPLSFIVPNVMDYINSEGSASEPKADSSDSSSAEPRRGLRRQTLSVRFPSLSSKGLTFSGVVDAVRAAQQFKRQPHKALANPSKKKNRPEESQQGILSLNIIRGELHKMGENIFGGKANPYVAVYYPTPEDDFACIDDDAVHNKGKPVYKGGTTPNFNMNDVEIPIRKGEYFLTFEVLDKNDMRVAENQDRLLLYAKVDIREWIANKRFEGMIHMKDAFGLSTKLVHSDGKVTNDWIQIAARVIYKSDPNSPRLGLPNQDSIMRPGDMFAASTAVPTSPVPTFGVTPRPVAVKQKVENEFQLTNPSDDRASSTTSRRPSSVLDDVPTFDENRLFFTKADREIIFSGKDEEDEKVKEKGKTVEGKSGSTSPVPVPRQIKENLLEER